MEFLSGCIRMALGVTLAAGALEAFAQPARPLVPTAPGSVRDMHLIGPGTGWVLTGQQILWTDNNGQTWTDITPPLESPQQIDSLYFLDSQHGWALLHSPWIDQADAPEIHVALTADGGRDWSTVSLNASLFVRQSYGDRAWFSFPDDMHGWLMMQKASSAAYSRGDLFMTEDGGKTWSAAPMPPVAGDIKFFSDLTGWLAGGVFNDQLYHTVDGGQSWKQVVMPLPAGVEPYSIPEGMGLTYHSHPFYYGPHFANEKQGLLVATLSLKQFGDPILLAYKTSDGGNTWVLQQVEKGAEFTGNPVLYDLDFVEMGPPATGVLALRHGQHSETRPLPSDFPRKSWIWKTDLLDPRNGWLLGSDGTLLSLNNGTLKAMLKPVPEPTKPKASIASPLSGGSGEPLTSNQEPIPAIGV